MKLYMDPAGQDSQAGTVEQPMRTFEAVLNKARTHRKKHPTERIDIVLRGGTHVLDQTLIILPEDSGTADGPLVIQAYPGEQPTLSGGRRIEGWQDGKINGQDCWVADLPEVASGDWVFTQLFVDGVRRDRTRLPETGYYNFAGLDGQPNSGMDWGNGPERAEFFEGHIKNWENIDDILVVPLMIWFEQRMNIESIDTDKKVVHFKTKSLNCLIDEKGDFARYFVENVKEAVLKPGQWYLDRKEGKLSYIPKPAETKELTQIVAPYLQTLLNLKGEPDGQKVEHVRFENINLRYAEFDLGPDCNGTVQAAFGVPGAVVLEDAQHCTLYGCTVSHIAQYGIELHEGCHDNRIVACEMTNAGAGGIKVQHQDPNKASHQQLPRPERNTPVPSMRTLISDCVIHDNGMIYPSAIGIWVGDASDNRLIHNHIFNMNYTGISVGWTWGYSENNTFNNHIEYNHIHHINSDRILSDNGGIYVLGVQPGSVMRGNVVHHIDDYGYGGGGIYPDEGSSEWIIENNLVYQTHGASISTHFGRDLWLKNNILAYPELEVIMPGRPEPHRTYVAQNNIIVWQGADLENHNPDWNLDHFKFENNVMYQMNEQPLYVAGKVDGGWGRRSIEFWQEMGQFKNTMQQDPLLTAPTGEDFSLRNDSPAIEHGFEPFDSSLAGPRHGIDRPISYDDWQHRDEAEKAQVVQTRIEAVGLPTWEGSQWSTPIRVTCNNLGEVPMTGSIQVQLCRPGECELIGDPTFSFNLEPGEIAEGQYTLTGPHDQPKAIVESIPQSDGLVPTALTYNLITTSGLPTPKVVCDDLNQLDHLLADEQPIPVISFGEKLGEFKVAVTDEDLLLQVDVLETQPKPNTEMPWIGSCIELFTADSEASTEGWFENPAIQHCFILPHTTNSEAQFLSIDKMFAPILPLDAGQVISEFTDSGYQVKVRLPLEHARLEPDLKSFKIEMIVAKYTPEGLLAKAHAFDTANPGGCLRGFGLMHIGK